MAGRRRLPVTIALGVLMLASLVLPHVGIQGHGLGRSLIPAGMLFSQIQAVAVGAPDLPRLALGINLTYLGIGLHQLGLLTGLASFWVLATEDINRWIYRIAVVAGWLLTASVPIVAVGWLVMRSSGAPVLAGWAWLPALAAGLGLILVARRSRERIDRSWYVARPELQ